MYLYLSHLISDAARGCPTCRVVLALLLLALLILVLVASRWLR